MSRRILRHDDEYEVIVGWDPPLRVFFAQVYDKSVHEDGNPIVWREDSKASPVLAAVEPYVDGSFDAAYKQLQRDFEGNVA